MILFHKVFSTHNIINSFIFKLSLGSLCREAVYTLRMNSYFFAGLQLDRATTPSGLLGTATCLSDKYKDMPFSAFFVLQTSFFVLSAKQVNRDYHFLTICVSQNIHAYFTDEVH